MRFEPYFLPNANHCCNNLIFATKYSFMRFIRILFLLLLLASGVALRAQQKTVIHIERALRQEYDKRLGEDIERLIGRVVLRQDSTWFYCDSAYLNEKLRDFEAFGNVHIKVSDTLHIYGDRLKYKGESREAEMFDHVKLVDDTTVLLTEYLIYYRLQHLAMYPDSGTIASGQNILMSKKGFYHSQRKEFYFSRNVELRNPEYTIKTDTMTYNTRSEIAWFYSPTYIYTDESTIYSEWGWYNTRTDQSQLEKNNRISGEGQTIEAGWLRYNRDTGYGEAQHDVMISDTANRMMITGETGRIWEDEGHSYVTGKALGISYDTEDSLFMHSDTLFLFFDKDRKAREMRAYFGTRFYRSDIQGVCDSLVYLAADSTLRMYKEPALWSGKNQLTADSIYIIIANQKLDSLIMFNSAFIISNDTLKNFNQVKGKNMVGYFVENELNKIFVDGNAQTVYWVREDDGTLIGINLSQSSTMAIKLEDNSVKGISYFSTPKEVMYPEKELPKEEAVLKGFKWLNLLRPTDKNDVFRRPEPQDQGQAEAKEDKKTSAKTD